MIWQVPKIWKGEDVWLIGGGPSLTSTFNIPEDIVSKVRTKELPLSSYSPYMKAIHEKHIIGINVAYQLGDWVDMMFCGDAHFLKEHELRLYGFSGMSVTCAPAAAKMNWVKYVERGTANRGAITQAPTKVVWNQSSGAAAINLAVHLGAARIILIAFDMNLVNNKQHWHNAYRAGDSTIPAEEQSKKARVLGRHLSAFPNIRKELDKLRIPIYNISPNSAITCVEKRTLQELL